MIPLWTKKLDLLNSNTLSTCVITTLLYNYRNSLKVHFRSETNLDIWKPFIEMKNAFYFTLKALFVLKVFKFSCWHFGHAEKRLD